MDTRGTPRPYYENGSREKEEMNSWKLKPWHYRIAIPKQEGTTLSDYYMGILDTGFEWHILPPDVYTHKNYPTCEQCKNKFVPIESKTICFRCNFLK